jgi:uncharacterized membrane protein YfcA
VPPVSGTAALDLTVIVVGIAIGAFIKGATGGGLPQVAIPVMAPFLGVEHAVVLMAIPAIVANGWLVITHRDTATRTRDLPVLLATSMVGAVAGTIALKSINGRWLSAVLAGVIVVYVVVALAHPGFRFPERLTRFASPPVGLVGGGLQGSTGISGPLFTTYLHGFQLAPRVYVFSLAVLFCVGAVVQAITLAVIGLYTAAWLAQSLLALLPIAVFLPIGSAAARRISPDTFQRIVLVLVAASAVSLVHNAVSGS